MSDRRKKARMMSDSERDDDILTLRFLMNGKVRYIWLVWLQFGMIWNIKYVVPCSCFDTLTNRLLKELHCRDLS